MKCSSLVHSWVEIVDRICKDSIIKWFVIVCVYVGVELNVTEMLTVMEGGMGDQICVRVSEGQPEHERTITVHFPEVIFQTMYTGMSNGTQYECSTCYKTTFIVSMAY